MSNITDKSTIQQTAINIKSQRQERLAEAKQQEEIDATNKAMLYYFIYIVSKYIKKQKLTKNTGNPNDF